MDEVKTISKGIIEMLRMKGKLELLPEVISELQIEEELRHQQVVIESAEELNEVDLQDLMKMLIDKLGFRPQVTERINPELLGGVKLKIGDQIIDVSLKYRLEQLKKSIN